MLYGVNVVFEISDFCRGVAEILLLWFAVQRQLLLSTDLNVILIWPVIHELICIYYVVQELWLVSYLLCFLDITSVLKVIFHLSAFSVTVIMLSELAIIRRVGKTVISDS